MRKLKIGTLFGERYPDASFHDAVIETIKLDYISRQIDLECVLYVGNPEDDEVAREATARGQLTLTGLLYCVLQPPDETYPYEEDGLDVSNDVALDRSELTSLGSNLPRDIPDDAFVHYFFINNHNSALFIAATGAHFTWK